MPLPIQVDESLQSYVRRNLLLCWGDPKAATFETLAATSRVIKADAVRMLAAEFGWPGCYGFNRLVHCHTMHAAFHVIKNDWDISYSGSDYISPGVQYSEPVAWFCPDCVREDVATKGFSYWRRYGKANVSVCYKHNTVLLRNCPFCGKVFTRADHYLDVMWRTCDGRHLAEAEAIANHDPLALKRAEVCQRLCTSPVIISGAHAAWVLLNKAAALNDQVRGEASAEILSISARIGQAAARFAGAPSPSSSRVIETTTAAFIDALALLYDSYDDFEKELLSLMGTVRRTDSLWSCYMEADRKYIQYVEEDYKQRLKYWSYPSIAWNEWDHRVRYHNHPPRRYNCCNSPLPSR